MAKTDFLKLLVSKKLKFTQDSVKVNNVKVMLMFYDTFSKLKLPLSNTEFEEVAKIHARSLLKEKTQNSILDFTETISITGLGHLSVIKQEEKEIVFHLINNPLVEEFVAENGLVQKPVDIYFLHMLKELMRHYWNTEVTGKETKCKAVGNDVCEFVITRH